MYEIVKTVYETCLDTYIRPDHGRMIWGETGRPGYGLYDCALGAAYLNGLWKAIEKRQKGHKMKLNYQGIQDKTAWEAANITLPAFDWKQIVEKTKPHMTTFWCW